MEAEALAGAQRSTRNFKRFLYILMFFVIPIFYAFETTVHWSELTVCMKREAFFLSIFFFYLRYGNPANPGFLFDLLQILLIVWIIQQMNIANLQEDPTCLETGDSLYLYSTEFLFQMILWVCTVMSICVLIMLVGLIIFGIMEAYIYRPRRRRRQGLSTQEFSRLKKVEFRKEDIGENSNLDTCSICLEEFVEKQTVIQMPGCRHNFHEGCVKGWLEYHSICPNCRSDLREQFTSQQRPQQHENPEANGSTISVRVED